MTENFIVVPETSYMYDPCVRSASPSFNISNYTCNNCNFRKFGDPDRAGWEQSYSYESDAPALVSVMRKTNGSEVHQVGLGFDLVR